MLKFQNNSISHVTTALRASDSVRCRGRLLIGWAIF